MPWLGRPFAPLSVDQPPDPAESPSHWLVGVDPDPPPSLLPPDAEVVVIGGGVMGISTAYWLTRLGLRVLLLEARCLGWGATGRNAGLMLAGRGPLEDPALVRSVLDEEAIDADLSRPGHLALATSPEVWTRIQAEADDRADDPSPVRALDRAACEDLLGLRIDTRILGGRWLACGGMVHPVRLAHGLAAAARRRGATLAPGTPALEVAAVPGQERLRVLTTRGTVRCRHVVFACGGAVRGFLARLDRALTPARAQVLSTEPLPRLFRIGLAIDWGTVYWRQAPDGAVVLGGYRNLDPEGETGWDERLNDRIQGALAGFLPALFPDLPAVRVARRWAAIMDCSADGRPLVGACSDAPNQWIIAGFGGHGLPVALGAGRALAEAIVGGRTPASLESLDPMRFEVTASGRRR